ncbi:hypothetical protein BX666DRAFT_1848958 [Dichotomocladium elegans]|nr:hypothetical protein BX666DRAFT_1848958 [Dichotomocladium elegans]
MNVKLEQAPISRKRSCGPPLGHFQHGNQKTVVKQDIVHSIDIGISQLVTVTRQTTDGRPRGKIIKKEITATLEKDIIKTSTSSWASPLVVVDEADGSNHICTNHKKFNQITVKDR